MAHLSEIQIGKHARVLAAALALGAAVLSLSTGQAEARAKRPVDNGTRCIFTSADGYIDFFMPGETINWGDETWRCGADGKWRLVRTNSTPVGPQTGGGEVLAP
jgi:hypothetical protein